MPTFLLVRTDPSEGQTDLLTVGRHTVARWLQTLPRKHMEEEDVRATRVTGQDDEENRAS